MIPNNIEVAVLNFVLAAADLKLKLFSNNYTPGETSVVGSFTEVTGGGYVAKTLSVGNWTITSGDPSTAAYPAQTFSFTGAIGGSGNVYGYYITNVAGTVLYAAGNLPGTVSPFTPSNGGYVRITPTFAAS